MLLLIRYFEIVNVSKLISNLKAEFIQLWIDQCHLESANYQQQQLSHLCIVK